MSERTEFKAGTRESKLALIQTDSVLDKLKQWGPECQIDVVAMSTLGDNVLNKPLPKVGKSVFTKELEEPLADERLDFVVHSMKDVSTALPDGLTIGAVLEREDPRDCIITKKAFLGTKLINLPKGSVIGTSSLRRAAQLRKNFPHLKIEDVRGNLNTRLKKLDDDNGKYDAIVLALAGVRRMNWDDRVSEILEPTDMLYAVGQGALAVECRSADSEMLSMLETLNHKETILRVIAERSFMQTLGGGCTAPLAVNSYVKNDTELTLEGGVWRLDGSEALMDTLTITLPAESEEPPTKYSHLETRQYTGIMAKNIDPDQLEKAYMLGVDLAKILTAKGAAEIVAAAKKEVAGPALVKPEKNELS